MNEVIIATKNSGKAKEFVQLFESYGITVKTLIDYPELPDVEETGETFEENALLKAESAARLTGQPAIADDSGLVIDALDGRPGVYSARYAGIDKDDKANNRKVLKEMAGAVDDRRSARFKCVLAVSFPDDREPIIVEGNCEGRIAYEESGTNGFGYDPLFIPDGFDQTMAQLEPDVKNKISHRANALRKLQVSLTELEGELK
ncbi:MULTISPECIES: XTP/dITP diphosphatase [Bacillaceae]|uniref:dITP/XTP pyrophosphatase n=1 Tax=Domibacillus aminovorans TaxID=29332 RepID=A0A177KS42_9BACI|nr:MULTISPECIES: XTP/dITP diphosphatase [Bacillaceae]OAH56170.1 non-canonical purine NTP pyrophosphatase [Domibacillus aminovorans]